jgi:hypothetical protein
MWNVHGDWPAAQRAGNHDGSARRNCASGQSDHCVSVPSLYTPVKVNVCPQVSANSEHISAACWSQLRPLGRHHHAALSLTATSTQPKRRSSSLPQAGRQRHNAHLLFRNLHRQNGARRLSASTSRRLPTHRQLHPRPRRTTRSAKASALQDRLRQQPVQFALSRRRTARHHGGQAATVYQTSRR